ncbi:UNVERIFIED_ORG: hypothetical protein ABIC34_003877 [Sphingomonas sp. 1057]
MTEEGCCVRADTMMPSGLVIKVHIRPDGDSLFLHDGGAAFDELACQGLSFSKLPALRRMLGDTGFGISTDGLVHRSRVPLEKVATGVAFLADASLRAAQFMIERAEAIAAKPLDREVKEALRLRYPQGRPNFMVAGKNRQHRFDFGMSVDGETVVIEAVNPDHASINAAIVKALDVKEVPDSRTTAFFVIDPLAHWKSDQLNMLGLGGISITLERLKSAPLHSLQH